MFVAYSIKSQICNGDVPIDHKKVFQECKRRVGAGDLLLVRLHSCSVIALLWSVSSKVKNV